MHRNSRYLFVIGFISSIIFSLVFVLVTGLVESSRRLYSQDQTHRLQTESILDGHLSLQIEPEQMTYDYVYIADTIQQVWGLGVPILRAPFVSIYTMFPDRLILTFYIFIALVLVFRLGYNLSGNIWRGVVTQYVALFMLPVFSVAMTRFIVYEETIFYGYLATISLGSLLYPLPLSKRRIICVAVLAGFVGFIRPTLVLYGLVAMFIAVWNERSLRIRVGAVTIFGIGVGLLLFTNLLRFGAPLEFGHSLNVDTVSYNNYSLKFDYPFRNVGVSEAWLELAGAFVLGKHGEGDMFDTGLVYGESDTVRWRSFYSAPFGIILSLLTVTSVVVFATRFRTRRKYWGIYFYGIVSSCLLVLFYLNSPSISSRYMVDFAPAVFMILLGFVFSSRNIKAILFVVVLVVTLGAYGEFDPARRSWSREVDQKQAYLDRSAHGLGLFASNTGIHDDGTFDAAILVYARHPKFVELVLSPDCDSELEHLEAKLSHDQYLPQISVPNNQNIVARFEIDPMYSQYALQSIFIKTRSVDMITATSTCKLVSTRFE